MKPVGLFPPTCVRREKRMSEIFEGSGEPIFDADDVESAYGGAEEIEEAVLHDVTRVAREAGFLLPVALSKGAWEECVAWAPVDNERKGTLQSEEGRLWDVLWMAVNAIRVQRRRMIAPFESLLFCMLRISREGKTKTPEAVKLALVYTLGDELEPVITIYLPDEE
jgi:hypothetical protein